MLKYLIPLLLLCSGALADDPVVPVAPPVVEPPKAEIKISVPKGVLGDGKRLSPFVFDSTTKCYLTLPLTDPVSIKSLKWIVDDGPPDIEPIGPDTAEAPSTILGFSQATPGLYLVEANWDKGFSKLWLEIKGSGPSPPIVVPPVIVPDNPTIPPGPNVDPNVSTGFRVMFIYETADKLTKDQSNILTSVRIRKYLDSKCTKGTEGQYKGLAEYRFWDKDGKDSNKDSTNIQKMWIGLKPSVSTVPMPFMAIQANGKNVVVPLREGATIDSVMTKLVELGGPE